MSFLTLYHVFLPNGEFWLTPRCTSEIRQVGAIVYNSEDKKREFYEWNGENWETDPLEKLPRTIKAFLLIYPIPAELKEQFRVNRDSDPVYICKWR